MSLRGFAAAALLLTVVCLPLAAAAQTSPIVQHYRAYLAALERGDLDAATSEAQAALAASEARDGDGGRTAVLAFNLANVHVQAGRYLEAEPLAQRALALARGGAQGVDPVLARIVIARTGLALNGGSRLGHEAASELAALLATPTLTSEDVYTPAAQLGNWALTHGEYELARDAWSLAAGHPDGSAFGEAYGLGRARTNEAVAIIASELDDGRRISQDDGDAAHALLSEAMRVLYPLTREVPGLQLTVAQQAYSEARVWLSALESKLHADGRRVPEQPAEAQGDADGMSEIGPADLTRPRCLMRLVAQPTPRFPSIYQVGSVMLFLRIDAEGEVAHFQIAARAGSEEFAEAVERVAGRWRVERLDTSAPNCRMESNVLQLIRFVAAR